MGLKPSDGARVGGVGPERALDEGAQDRVMAQGLDTRTKTELP